MQGQNCEETCESRASSASATNRRPRVLPMLLDLRSGNASSVDDVADEPARSPRKAVRFADSMGHPLTLTHEFVRDNSPTPNDRRSRHQNCIDNTLHCITDTTTGQQCSPGANNVASNNNNENISTSKGPCLNFNPSCSSAVLQERVLRENVCLEELMFTESRIRGRILVRNLAYEKNVIIRYTLDAWSSFIDKQATYLPFSCTKLTDTFEFGINYGALASSGGKTLEFALCYTVPNAEFWDNNFGDNYRLDLDFK